MHDVNARAPRLPLVDSLRAIAALTVLLTHTAVNAGVSGNPHSTLSPYAQRLDVGVTIFFLISGLLLYRPFVRARATGQTAPPAGPYAWRRFTRIVPAYWLALTVTALWVGTSTVQDGVFTLHGGPYYYLLAQTYSSQTLSGGLTQAWTLTIEVAFYVFVPVWAWVGRTVDRRRTTDGWVRREVIGLIVLALCSEIWKLAVLSPQNPHQVVITPALDSLPTFLDQFSLGMGLAVLGTWLELRDGPPPRWLGRFDRCSGLSWLVAVLAFWIVAKHAGIDPVFFAPMGVKAYLARHALYAVVALGLLLPAAIGRDDQGLPRRILALRPLAWLGLVSYGIYLWQAPVLAQLDRWHFGRHVLIHPWLWWSAGTFVGSAAIAAASYYGLERPLLRLVRRRTGPSPGIDPGEAIAEPVVLMQEPSRQAGT